MANASIPPVNITVKAVGSRADAGRVADCLRALGYSPVSAKRGDFEKLFHP